MTWILGGWKLMFQILRDLLVTRIFMNRCVKCNFVVLSFAACWSWVKVSVEMFISLFLRTFHFVFKGQCLQRLARTWELCASNAHPCLRAFSQCIRRKAIYEIYACHCKSGPYRIKAAETNFYSLINSVPKNYNTKEKKTVNKKIRWWWNLNQITNKAWVSPL